MASNGSLPLYYKNFKATGLSGPAKSWKDNYLLVVVFVGFIILIAGTFWFLPPLEDKDADYEKTYGRFTGNPAAYITDPVIPSEPTLEPPESTEKKKTTEELEPPGINIKEVVGEKPDDKGEEEEEREREERLKEPVYLSDLDKEDKEAKLFEKHATDLPSDASSPSEAVRPVAVGGAAKPVTDPEAEERKQKVVEVCIVVCGT